MSELPGLALAAWGLFSRRGFHDGDLIGDWLDDAEDRGYDIARIGPVDTHDVLCRLVTEHLIPKIPYPFTIYRVSTSHNPIRVDTWQGREWDISATEPREVENICVMLPGSAVLDAIWAIKAGSNA
jgi:hypothetical protein